MKLMGLPIDQLAMSDMRRSLQNIQDMKRNAKINVLFALHHLNEAIVGCIEKSVKEFLIIPVRSVAAGVSCVFKPVTDLIKITLKIILNSVKLIQNLHQQVETCPNKESVMRKICLTTLHAGTVAKFVKSLTELIIQITKTVKFLSGVGLQTRIITCSVKGAVHGLNAAKLVGIKLGKCVLCESKGICK